MPRPVWSGSISFGMVNVPVKAHSAVHDHTVHFHQLEKGTGARIRYEKVSAKTGEPVAQGDIEKGYEIDDGEYVVIEPDEFEELRPRSTRSIDITDFVDLAAVDPIYYERTYWLLPDGDAAARAYRLLRAAMEDAQLVAIGTVVMRNKQYLTAIRPLDGALAMSTMRFADEVVPVDDVGGVPSRTKPAARERELAAQMIDAMTSDWDPTRYHDTYTEQMRELIEAKAKGQEITVEAAEEPGADVLDLMEALKASVERQRSERGRGRRGGQRSAASAAQGRSGAGRAAKRPSAKRSAAKRSGTHSSTKRPAKRSGGSHRVKKSPARKQAAKRTPRRASA